MHSPSRPVVLSAHSTVQMRVTHVLPMHARYRGFFEEPVPGYRQHVGAWYGPR